MLRILVLMLAVGLVLGVSACGSDDDGGDGGNAAADTADGGAADAGGEGDGGGDAADAGASDAGASGDDFAVGGGSDEEQIEAVYNEMNRAIYAADYAAACARMDKLMRTYYGLLGKDCADGMESQLGKDGPPASLKPRFVKVNVKGDKATGQVEIAGEVQKTPLYFVKVDGEWQVTGTVRDDIRAERQKAASGQ